MTTPVVISNNAEYASIALNHIGECNVGGRNFNYLQIGNYKIKYRYNS